MPTAFFQIQLSVTPKRGGEAELVPPKVLEGLNCRFVIVKEGGEEAIVRLEESESMLKKVERARNCNKVTPEQVETMQKSYPPPKLKKKFRMRARVPEGGETEETHDPFIVDEKGDRIVDVIQTVRSGFYLIDVPLLLQSAET